MAPAKKWLQFGPFLLSTRPTFADSLHKRRAWTQSSVSGWPVSLARTRITDEAEIHLLVIGSPQLVAQGAQASESSARILLRLYLDRGMKMLHQIYGAFACILADDRHQEVYCVRDRFGYVPLFYLQQRGVLLCSTCLPGLLQAAHLDLKIDPVGLLRYYLFRYVVPPLTLYQNIKQVQPAHYLVVKRGTLGGRRYVSLPQGQRGQDDNVHLQGELQQAITRAVCQESREGQKVSVALSGGLDSAIIAAILAGRNQEPLQAFSLRTREAGHMPALVAFCRQENLALSTFDFCECDYLLLPRFLAALGEPVCVFPLFYLYLLVRKTQGLTRRLLLGEGGDELFLGYRHQVQLLQRFVAHHLAEPHSRQGPFRRERLTYRLHHLHALLGWRPSQGEIEQALDCLPAEKGSCDINDFLDVLVEQELTCYPYFFAGPRLGAGFAVDIRCPFLHPDVIDLAFTLPWQALVTPGAASGVTKAILRKTFSTNLPEAILTRPKEGFGERWTLTRQPGDKFGFLFEMGLRALQAAGLPVNKDSSAEAGQPQMVERAAAIAFEAEIYARGGAKTAISASPLNSEQHELFWQTVFLGIWFESVASDRGEHLMQRLSGS